LFVQESQNLIHLSLFPPPVANNPCLNEDQEIALIDDL